MVFVVQESPSKNIQPARAFGEIEVILPVHDIHHTGPMVDRLYQALCSFNDDDYLLPLGSPVAIGVAGAIAAPANDGRVRWLKWDRQSRCYIVVETDLPMVENL